MWIKGVPRSEKTKKRIGLGQIGRRHSNETKRLIGLGNKGKIVSQESRFLMSRKHRGLLAGKKHPNWKGDITPNFQKLRNSEAYKEWRMAVFKRDYFRCILCGYDSTGSRPADIQADHIKPFSLFPELRFDIENGRTLCVPCHRKTDTWGGLRI